MGLFDFRSRPRSFAYAIEGVWALLATQPNARIHMLATVLVLGLAAYCDVERWEWAVLVLVIACVWAVEALNTAVESLADACHPEQHPIIKRAKDVAAAAVLFLAIAAIVIAGIIFYPYIQPLLG